MFLLDTNVVSEFRNLLRNRSTPQFAAWAASVDQASLFVSTITLHELQYGVLLLERRDPQQAAPLRAWLSTAGVTSIAARALAVDAPVARLAASLRVPNPAPLADSLIAATALVHRLTIVTRNVADFRHAGLEVVNPWNG